MNILYLSIDCPGPYPAHGGVAEGQETLVGEYNQQISGC
jgi:hypothetical protein